MLHRCFYNVIVFLFHKRLTRVAEKGITGEFSYHKYYISPFATEGMQSLVFN